MERFALAGELALDGSIRPVPGALAMAEGARSQGLRGIAVAPGDAPQAALVEGLEVVALDHVARLPALAAGSLEPAPEADRSALTAAADPDAPDLADLKGQPTLRRALEIAAAGGHSLLLTGPPGAGKTLAARRLPSLMPPLEQGEALEVIRIAGACGAGPVRTPVARPFRAPHHTASARALIGGGTPPRPGEVTRAHRGILFLDELAEFRRDALEALRQPLEESVVTLSRASATVSLPCRFTLVAASNPCPCGHGTDSGECECHHGAAARYQAKLSGALADRIDIQVPVDRPSAEDLAEGPGEGSAAVRERVAAARRLQGARLGAGRCNAEMSPKGAAPALRARPRGGGRTEGGAPTALAQRAGLGPGAACGAHDRGPGRRPRAGREPRAGGARHAPQGRAVSGPWACDRCLQRVVAGREPRGPDRGQPRPARGRAAWRAAAPARPGARRRGRRARGARLRAALARAGPDPPAHGRPRRPLLGLLPSRRLLPAAPAGPRRRPRRPVRPRGPRAAGRARRAHHSHDRRLQAPERLRARAGRVPRQAAGLGGGGRRQRHGAWDRLARARGRARRRRGPHGRGAGRRGGDRHACQPREAVRADRRPRAGAERVAARERRRGAGPSRRATGSWPRCRR